MSWEVTNTETTTREWNNKKSSKIRWRETEEKIKPNHTMICNGYAARGEFDMGYTSKVTLTLEDDSTFEFNEHGKINDISFSQSVTHCEQKEGDATGEADIVLRDLDTVAAVPFNA
jgi:hypothetical protein